MKTKLVKIDTNTRDEIVRALLMMTNESGFQMMMTTRGGVACMSNSFDWCVELCGKLGVETVNAKVPIKKGRKWVEERIVGLKSDYETHMAQVEQSKSKESTR